MIYNFLFLFLYTIPYSNAFCESRINNSIVLQNTYNISIIGNEFKTEIGNSLSSLIYSGVGFYGIFINNHDFNYYVLMNIFILMGLSSALHHFLYTNNSWAYYSDILCVELIISYFLFCIIHYVIKKHKHLFSFLILINLLTMMVSNTINTDLRTELIKVNMGVIIVNQTFINLHIIYVKNKHYGLILLKHNISNIILFSLSIIFFYNDDYCNEKTFTMLNPHSLWHVFSALALYNSLHTTIIYYCLINNVKYKILNLTNIRYLYFIDKFSKYLLLNVELDNNKYKNKIIKNTKNSATSINIEDVRLLNMENGFHRRIRSYG
jgi:hypothetical protein